MIRATLRKLEILRDLTDWEIDRFLAMARDVRLPAGAALALQGEVVTATSASAWLLVAGGLRVIRTGPEQQVLADVALEPGVLVGVIALILDAPRAAGIVASTDARLLAIDRAAFDHMYEADSRLAVKFRLIVARQLARDLRRANARMSAPAPAGP